AGRRPAPVGERDPERPALARIELMHLAGHHGRDPPPRHRTRVEQRPIDERPRRVHVEAEVLRGHANDPNTGAARRRTSASRLRPAPTAYSGRVRNEPQYIVDDDHTMQ